MKWTFEHVLSSSLSGTLCHFAKALPWNDICTFYLTGSSLPVKQKKQICLFVWDTLPFCSVVGLSLPSSFLSLGRGWQCRSSNFCCSISSHWVWFLPSFWKVLWLAKFQILEEVKMSGFLSNHISSNMKRNRYVAHRHKTKCCLAHL